MSDTAAPLSVEERLMAFVEAEDSVPVPEEERQSLNGSEPEVDEEDQIEESEEEVVDDEEAPPPRKLKLKHNDAEIEVDEDEAINLAQQGYDYTQKTQKLAEERRQFEARAQALRNTEMALQRQIETQAALSDDFKKVAALDEQIAAFRGADWNAITDADPVQAQKLFFQFNQLQTQRQELAAELNKKQQQFQQAMAERIKQQTMAGLEQLKRDVPDWGPDKAKEVRSSARNYGFTDEELSGITDPRVVRVLLDAAQWRNLQNSKPVTAKKVSTATTPVKPGAKDPKTAAQSAIKQTREALRKTGKSDYAAKLIERML